MKLSVSLPESDVKTLDSYAAATGLRSRSAALQHAIRLLAQADLDQAYADAWDEWEADAGTDWETVAADGLDGGLLDAAR